MDRLSLNSLREIAFYIDNVNTLNKNEIISKLKKSNGFYGHTNVTVYLNIENISKKSCNLKNLINEIDNTINSIIKKDLSWNENLDGLPSSPILTDIEIDSGLKFYLIASEFIKKNDFKKWYTNIFNNNKIKQVLLKKGIKAKNVKKVELL